VLRIPLRPYAAWTLLGALLWCLTFAGVGWALAGAWEGFHRSFRYADYIVAAAVVALIAATAVRRRRRAAAAVPRATGCRPDDAVNLATPRHDLRATVP